MFKFLHSLMKIISTTGDKFNNGFILEDSTNFTTTKSFLKSTTGFGTTKKPLILIGILF